MKLVTVNGKPHKLRSMTTADLKPGTLIRPFENRSVYRIVCRDGEEYIVRNVRYAGLIEAVEADEIVSRYHCVVPTED